MPTTVLQAPPGFSDLETGLQIAWLFWTLDSGVASYSELPADDCYNYCSKNLLFTKTLDKPSLNDLFLFLHLLFGNQENGDIKISRLK